MVEKGYDYLYSPYNIFTFTVDSTSIKEFNVVGKYLRILNFTSLLDVYINSESGFHFQCPLINGLDNFEFRKLLFKSNTITNEVVIVITSDVPIQLPMLQSVKNLSVFFDGSQFWLPLPSEKYTISTNKQTLDIRDTNYHSLINLNITKYRKIEYLISNTLDQTVTIELRSYMSDTSTYVVIDTVDINAGSKKYYIGDCCGQSMSLYAKCSSSPSSGSLIFEVSART